MSWYRRAQETEPNYLGEALKEAMDEAEREFVSKVFYAILGRLTKVLGFYDGAAMCAMGIRRKAIEEFQKDYSLDSMSEEQLVNVPWVKDIVSRHMIAHWLGARVEGLRGLISQGQEDILANLISKGVIRSREDFDWAFDKWVNLADNSNTSPDQYETMVEDYLRKTEWKRP